jgi:RNA recognition motif-containing protein
VGDLEPSVNNILLMQTFKQVYPSVYEAKIICDPVTRVSKGYGFIKFSLKEESERALQEMQGKTILGRAIKMNYASQRNKN